MAEPFIINSFFLDYILPFVLVFVLVFAILERSKLLGGEEARKVNAIIGMVVGLLLIATPYARNIVNQLMPFLAVIAVILLVFMLLYGFIAGKDDGKILNKGLIITFGVLLAIALAVFLAMITGFWDLAKSFVFNGSDGSKIIVNGLVIVVVIIALIAVLWGGKKAK